MLPFRRLNLFYITCCLFLFFSCNPNDRIEIEKSASAFDIEQGKASILQGDQNFIKAFKAGDSTNVSNSYSTDAKIMAADTPAIVGREAIKHYIASLMQKGVKNFEFTTLKIWGDSSLLAEEGTYILADSIGKQEDKGKYIVLWKPETGNWKMFRHIWTSDLSPRAALPKGE